MALEHHIMNIIKASDYGRNLGYLPNLINDYTAEDLVEWAQALTSGEFQQGCSVLYHQPSDSYCCLGVRSVVLDGASLLDLDELVMPLWSEYDDQGQPFEATRRDGDDQFAPLNDDYNWSFDAIALWLLSHLDGNDHNVHYDRLYSNRGW